MSIKIHHGAPGTYKTSGAMGDDFLREAREGRLIVTNVRGVSRERTFEVFDDLPAKFEIVWIDDRTEEGRDKLRKWFHWVPKGAFLFIDEAQDIWPRHWRDSDLAALNYPGGREQAKIDDRPVDWAQAWDKHRHWNWDLVLTTPNIKKLRDDIRGVADGAYKHKDLALLGFGGRYVEGFHGADDNGTAESHFYSITRKKVPPYVWKLYDSTATGFFSGTKSGSHFLKNPKLLFLLAILFVSLGYSVSNSGSLSLLPSGMQAHKPAPVASPAPSVPSGGQVRQVRAVPAAHSPADVPSDGKRNSVTDDVTFLPFTDGEAVIVGTSKIKGRFRYHIDLGDAYITSDDFQMAGYKMTALGDCAVRFEQSNYVRVVRCGRQAGSVAKSPEKPQAEKVEHSPFIGVIPADKPSSLSAPTKKS